MIIRVYIEGCQKLTAAPVVLLRIWGGFVPWHDSSAFWHANFSNALNRSVLGREDEKGAEGTPKKQWLGGTSRLSAVAAKPRANTFRGRSP